MSNDDDQTPTRPAKKQRVTMYLDPAILEAFRAQAAYGDAGYQTLINNTLRIALDGDNAPLTVKTLRQVLREEFDRHCPQPQRAENAAPSNN